MKSGNSLQNALVISLLIACTALPVSGAPETFNVDPVHSVIVFRIKHSQVSYFYGRFNNPEGTFVVDQDNPENYAFNIQVPAANVDTGNENRDNHLRSPDFLNARQFRTISFKSSSVKKTADKTFEVTGMLGLHGVEKEITVMMEEIGREKSRGNTLMGFEGKFTIKRSQFGMDGMIGPLGDEVTVIVGLEGALQS